MSIEVTAAASDKIKEFIEMEGKSGDYGLRISVVPGGCSGFEYNMGLDTASDLDKKYGIEEGQVFVNDASLPYLSGATIDFIDSINGSGFKISNPNAQNNCGCGSSFGV